MERWKLTSTSKIDFVIQDTTVKKKNGQTQKPGQLVSLIIRKVCVVQRIKKIYFFFFPLSKIKWLLEKKFQLIPRGILDFGAFFSR